MDKDTFMKIFGMIDAFQTDLQFTREKLRQDLLDELDRNEQNAAEQVQYQEEFNNEDYQDFLKDLDKKDEMINELENKLSTKQGEISNINLKTETKNGEIDKLNIELSQVNKENESLKTRLTNILGQNQDMRDKLIDNEKQRVEYEFYKDDLEDKTNQLNRMGNLEKLYIEGQDDMKNRLKYKTETQLKNLNDKISKFKGETSKNKALYEGTDGKDGLKAQRDQMFADLEQKEKDFSKIRQTFLTETENHARNKVISDDIKKKKVELEKKEKDVHEKIEKLNKSIDDYNSNRLVVKEYSKYQYRSQVVYNESNNLHEDRWVILPIDCFTWDNQVMKGSKKKVIYQRRPIISDDWKGNVVYGKWEDYKIEESETYHKT